MATCVFQNCVNEGGNYKLKFTCNETKQRYYSNVKMCVSCWERMHGQKDQHGNAQLDILFSHAQTDFLVDYDFEGKKANVQELRFID